ncbi:tRNA 2-thiouridine(34) synthase MnmA [Aquella oligotrophica]|uniref:tRNA-specific 2-thiouridylase MnmA n=1 Tax=Aquella oligotrophica TaxID=2067065 RepID=A0A2I7N4X9_9NEIS|nr:tRNA 2-thiouridine(34) synthase MnmA [Aquella oligotrophica]AUR51523.1 tRNA 2-thiouridine(34) synthase MnmA [Aquella oligotrophica]
MAKIVMGMSGGVDSSVAAYLLKQEGHDVTGIFMQNWEDDDNDEYCTIKEDSLDAIAVADVLGIDIEIVNFAKNYKDRVFSYFLDEYQAGRTPNPDILCNSEIKFKAFLEHALTLGADYIATGHYVGKTRLADGELLMKAEDSNKDQSYFLYRLNQYQIAHSLFPLAKITKPEIRKLATELNLPNANKKDSTGICFIGERPFREFLQKYLPTKTGKMVTPDGKIVAEHSGLMYYTIGQRKGLGIGGQGEPWFVADKNLASNELIVVQGHNHPLLLKKSLTARQLSFGLDKLPAEGIYTAKTRYRMQDAKCNLKITGNDEITLDFDEAQWAITPGQSVVIYDGNLCLGGGIIL